MNLTSRLENAVEEYLNLVDRKQIKLISVTSRKYSEQIAIIESSKLDLRGSEPFSLSVIFSIKYRSKRGKALMTELQGDSFFKGFLVSNDKMYMSFSRNCGINKADIVATVEAVIQVLCHGFEPEHIKVEMRRSLQWHKLQ